MRAELIYLDHHGSVQRIAVRFDENEGLPRARLYFQDYLWEVTVHAKSHSNLVDGCKACRRRSRLLELIGPELNEFGS